MSSTKRTEHEYRDPMKEGDDPIDLAAATVEETEEPLEIDDDLLEQLTSTESSENGTTSDPNTVAPETTGPRLPDPVGSPVVAVCGLSGGAGASTLTLLLGFVAAAQGRGNVLVGDTGGAGSSLAAFTKTRSDHSLTSAAQAHRLGLLETSSPFVEISPLLRMIAREPELAGDDLADYGPELADLLAEAQDAHLAVFVDCGRLEKDAEIAVARQATHIVWVTDATATGVRKARATLSSTGLTGSQANIVFVRGNTDGLSMRSERELRHAAEEADALLLFCRHAGDVVSQGVEGTAARIAQPLKVALGRIL